MAKTRRAPSARTSARKPAARRGQAPKRGPARPARPAQARYAKKATSTRKPTQRRAKPATKAARPKAARPTPKPQAKAVPAPKVETAPPPQAPARKPTYHEAVSMYERGLQALQRRDFAAAADALRNVIERYPDERELLERARLYLKVCERELEPKDPTPKTADEWVYAATVALNSGDETTAVQHLHRALGENARHDHAHYMMTVASVRRNDISRALDHLKQAIALNPENRSLARQDPDLDPLREDPGYKSALDTPRAPGVQPGPVVARPRRVRR